MENLEASYLSSIRKKYSFNVDKPKNEATVEPPGLFVLQSFLDRDKDESEELEFVSYSCVKDDKEYPIEDLDMDSSAESMSKSSSESETEEAEAQPRVISEGLTENKRSPDAMTNESVQLKCRPDESSKVESDVRSVVADLHDNKSGLSEAPVTDESVSEKQKHAGSSGKRRRSRWDQKSKGDIETGEADRTNKRRKTKWTGDDSQLKILGPIQLPSFVNDFVTSDLDPEIQDLKVKLFEINSKLQIPELHDDRPEKERSPSSERVYDRHGRRKNKWEQRLRGKLIQDRQCIISRLIKKNSTFKPAAEYKPSKLFKKLYIPVKEYPEYNFVGLIIGPRGNTQKRMEKETGAKILLRGKGYSLRTPHKNKASDNEDLHVRIEADNQKSLDAAVSMVEKLLVPVDEGMNAHKQAQLAELGKLKEEKYQNMCQSCCEEGYPHYGCPHLQSTFETTLSCNICGSNNHATASCPLIGSSQGSKTLRGSSGFDIGSTPDTQSKPNKEISDADLYVGYLPQTVDVNRLAELFTPFGKIAKAKVIKDRTTGISKGFGFVKFENPVHSALALSHMHGYKIDGKTLAVRLATRQFVTGSSILNLDPNHPRPTTASQDAFCQTGWCGPLGSFLPEQEGLFTDTERMLPPASYLAPAEFCPEDKALGYPPPTCISSFQDANGLKFSHVGTEDPSSSPCSLAQFPGDPDFPGAQFKSHFAIPVSNSSSSPKISLTRESDPKPIPWPTAYLAQCDLWKL